MKHFLDISQCTQDDLRALIQRAETFKQGEATPEYPEYTVATLFYENSTRTRVSFQIAANHLRMPVINLDMQSSAERKGETSEDTIRTLAAMGVRLFVIRHAENKCPHRLAACIADGAHVINAGDGTHAHPTQAMLDMMTIMQYKRDLSQIKLVVVGDVRHSRVANSLQIAAQALGIGKLVFVSPEAWAPSSLQFGVVSHDLPQALQDADVIMGLRIQHERQHGEVAMALAEYRKHYAITKDMVRLAKPDAIIMHPGPVNRGIEMDDEVIDGSQSRILQQVQNGIFMRMAILERLTQA